MKQETPSTEGLLKVGELAKAAGVSVTTVKFYVKEGLIRPQCKTGKNMAYYAPSCVQAIDRIRTLQKERYYPLSVIKRLLESGVDNDTELDLLDAIHKVEHQPAAAPASLAEAVRQSGLSAAQIAALTQAELISPAGEGRRQTFSGEDMTVMALVRRRMDAGIPFAQSVRAFGIYARALREAAQADVDAFTAGALMVPNFDAEAGARMIRTSDETLDAFVGLKRKEYNRRYGSQRLGDLDRFEQSLLTALPELADLLERAGQTAAADQCRAVARSEVTGSPDLDRLAEMFWSFSGHNGGDIAKSIAASVRSREYFTTLQPDTLAAGCLKAAWLSLAPEILACESWAVQARADLAQRLRRDGLEDLAAALERILHRREEPS